MLVPKLTSMLDDFPSTIQHLPILTEAKTKFTTSADVDRQVSEALSSGNSLYNLDVDQLKTLKPSVIVTQVKYRCKKKASSINQRFSLCRQFDESIRFISFLILPGSVHSLFDRPGHRPARCPDHGAPPQDRDPEPYLCRRGHGEHHHRG